MLCIASLIVLVILSVFSAKYRPLVRESFDCVFRRVTFRPCNTGFDIKIKTALTLWLSNKSEAVARLFNRYFEIMSFVFVITFFISLTYFCRGIYLFWATGNCNGMNSGGFCVLDPSGKNNETSTVGKSCVSGKNPDINLTLSSVDLSSFFTKIGSRNNQVVFLGCYACPYTHEAYPKLKELIEKYSPTVTYVFYSTHKESLYLANYDYCIRSEYKDKYLPFIDKMYSSSLSEVSDESRTKKVLADLGVSGDKFLACLSSEETSKAVFREKVEIDKTGIYGTPTVFFDGKAIVGPKPYRVYRRVLLNNWF